jgi:two-component system, sensor histidine kinase and response regulator
MLSLDASASSYTLPSSALSRLRQLLQHMAETDTGLLITSEDVSSIPELALSSENQFTVLVSPSFSAVVQATLHQPELHRAATLSDAIQDETPVNYRVSLSFAPDAIATFLETLLAATPTDLALGQRINHALATLQPNDSRMQSDFTLQLVSLLTTTPNLDTAANSVPVHPAFRQPAATAIVEQIEQERLLNNMMTQIRQSFDLPFILNTGLTQVQQFLHVDRLVVYQLSANYPDQALAVPLTNPVTEPEKEDTSLASPQPTGLITYEAIATVSIPSVLGLVEECCFSQESPKFNLFRQGYTQAVDDINMRYASEPELLTFLHQARVRAKLIAPILVQGDLWGLLIAHQCDTPRQWQDSEKKFLQRVAEHFAIAINQSQLYREIQQQKEMLEQRVVERTQALRDAMLAAQSASQAKSEFLATVSHELRTPLTCVIGMSSTLIRWASTGLDNRQQRFLQTIHDSGEHLMGLINDMLELSQLEAGKAVLNLEDFSLTYLAQQTMRVVQDKANRAKVELVLDLQVNPQRDRFTADVRRVQQILLNLLTNAIKFTPEGGRVTLRVFLDTETAIFQVKDTGIGIPEQQRSLLFQKFQQLDPSYHRQYEGTGLGLALTKQLVEMHNGWIDVQSTVGQGSVFTVHLPARLMSSALPSNQSLNVALRQPQGRIILVENDEETAHIICDILNAAGYQIVWMLEPTMAIPQIEILQPFLVIANTWLSDKEGYDFIRQIRQNPTTKAIKIIALSPHISDENRQHSIEAGADDYLVKPILPEQVLQRVIALS